MLNAPRISTAACLLITVFAVVPAAAQSGPVAAYGFNETTGLTAADATGNGRTGTVSGALWTGAGRFGGALSFDGVNDRVNIADHALLDLTTGMTLEAWVYPTSLTGYRTVILKERPGELTYAIYASGGASRPAAWIATGIQVTTPGTAALPLNTWTHLAATYDGALLRLYVNGLQVSSQTHNGSITVSASPLRIGGNAIWGEYFAGRIDEVRVYARALSPTEIQADMIAPVIPPDVTAPAVTITSPAPDATVSGTLNITATASDAVGVSGVQFFLDGNAIAAEDTSNPYSIQVDTFTLTNGAHQLTARARDAAGNTATSTVVNVAVFNVPRLVITSPAPGAMVNGSTVPVTYTTIGDLTGFGVDHVHFYVDGGPERMDTSFDGSYNLFLVPSGTHILSGFLVRGDHSKISGTDATPVPFSNVVPDTTAPTVSVTAPASDANVNGTVSVSADAADAGGIVGVQFLLDGAALGAEDMTAPYSVNWTTTSAANGAHLLSARARDVAGNTTTSSAVAVTVDNAAPVVSITAPTSGSVFKGSVAVSADATDAAGVIGVQFLLDGAPLGPEDTTAPYVIDWDTTAASDGAHTLAARARDAAGNETASAGVAISVDNAAPAVTVTAPAEGATVDGTITVSADATDAAGVAAVQFLLDGAPLGAEDTTAPYAIEWQTTEASNSAHTLSARARDAAGNITTATGVAITVDNDTTAPTVTLSAPASEATVNETVTISADAADEIGVAGVQFLLDGAPLGAEDTTAPYAIDWVTTGATNGAHTLSARARDAAGNVTTSTDVDITVDNAGPTVTISAPTDGAIINGPVTVSADAADEIGVIGVQFLLDGAPLGAEDMTAPYSVEWEITGASNGPHTLTARARDTAGNATSASVAISIDTLAPTVTVTAPTSGATVNGTLTVAADAADAVGVVGVQFLLDGAPHGVEDTSAPYTIEWATTAGANGEHILSARARDAAGNTTTSEDVAITVSNDTIAPAADITAPASGATVTGTIAVSADAGDEVGVVGVQFLLDGAALGEEDTTAPYTIDWLTTATADGPHTLSVRARDAAGNAITSNGIVVTVDNAAPTSTVTAPAGGATVNGTITVAADAADAIGVAGVQFLLDGAPLGAEDTTAPYAIDWATTTVANGAHTLSVRARDAAGNAATSSVVAIAVSNDSAAPTVSITAPANSATVNGTITVTADAADDIGVIGVEFLVDGAPLGAEDSTAPYAIDWVTTAIANGAHTLSARARDAAGNVTTSNGVAITVSNDTTAPTVVMTAPSTGASVSGTISISATANDEVGVAGVQFLLDGAPLGAEDTAAPFAIDWVTTAVASGAHTLSARARDAAGNTTTSNTVAVTVDNVAPTVTITAPANAATINAVVTVSADAADAVGVVGVQFLLDGATLGAEDTAAPYSVSWTTTSATNGAHTLSARARDAAGNTTTSTSVSVTVDNAAPTVTITAPASGATVSGAVTVTANATDAVGVAGVQFLLDGAPLGAEDTTAPYSVSWTTTGASNGAHTLTARARDAVGNTATSAGVAVTVSNDSTAPTVAITAPASGATVFGTITMAADATDAVGVVGVQFLIDGAAFGAEDTTAPYAINWATTGALNGAHTLSARARDAAGNTTTSTAVGVTVSNASPNLVAAYSFDEGSGTAVSDSSGNNLTGTITAATWTTSGRYGKALTFNGTSALVTIADHALLDLATAMTLEAWVYPTALTNYRTVILKERPGDLAYALYANDGAPRPSTWITAGSTSATAVGTGTLTLNTWTHLAATYDGATLRLYVNGTQVGSQARTGSLFVSANPLRIGGNAIWGEYFAGRIDEVRVYSRALSASEIQNDMTAPVTPPVTDSTPPAVTMTSPAGGASLFGPINVSASASDNVGVAGVQFKLDGANLGAEDTTAPYAVSWNTALATIGPHTLTAVARDAAGNLTTSSPVAVNVLSSTDPSNIGQWSAPFELGVVAVNMALLHTGDVLMFSGTFATTGPERLFNPTTGTFSDVPLGRTNLFCAGHSQLSDGRLLVIGGHQPENGLLGSREVNIFDPVSRSWTPAASMADPRWYPTATTLADGRVLALSGGTTCLTCIADIPEVYDPVANNWTRLTGARLAFPYYPFSYLLPDGRVLNAGANEQPVATRALNLSTQTWTTIDPVIVDGHSSAMYRPGQIIKSGTATDSGGTGATAATAYVIDMNQPSPTWRQVASMANARAFHNTTILPTGDVLVTGGGTRRDGYDGSFAVRDAELWSPTTESWRTLSRANLPRLYHSGALLLPDGRVLIAGGGNDGPAVNYTRGEYFSPPYLFKGPRPSIASAPEELGYGLTFVVDTPNAASITAVSLIRPGAVTHGFDEAQRFMNLNFTREGGSLVITAPQNANLAPPGYYMLFLLAGEVPSTAAFVRLPSVPDDHTPPTPPSGLSAIGGLSSATLSWTASLDNTGVAAYHVHRSDTSGFTPSAANKIGQASGTGYVDALPGGTYYYVVTAADANGNVSEASNEAGVVIASDVTPPSVEIDSPADGAQVTGAIAIAATATDDIGVVGVQFELDAAPIGAEDTSAPYSFTWPTTSTTNGVHVLTAVARDAQGHQTRSAPVTVNVSNVQIAGLIAAFGFEEDTGSVVNDASGNGNQGQMTNAVRTASGRFGRALSFNGSNSIVSVADAPSLDLTTGMTLSAWVRPSATTGWRTVMLKERAPSLSYALYSHSNLSQPAGYIANPGDTAARGGSAPLNTWTHLAVTFDGSSLVLYVNGVEVNRAGPPGAMLTSTGALSIGGNNVWGEWFNGLIDEVRVYNRALSPSEIQADMNTAVGGS